MIEITYICRKEVEKWQWVGALLPSQKEKKKEKIQIYNIQLFCVWKVIELFLLQF